MAAGDPATARDATLFLFNRQQLADGSMPRNSLVNGKTRAGLVRHPARRDGVPDPDGRRLGLVDRPSLYTDHIKPAANFVVAHGPSFGVERWEEQSGYSPSTIAAEIAGLVAAARPRRRQPRRGLGPGLAGRRRRHAALGQGLDRDDERAARPATRTSSGCRRPATPTPPSPTTSATAGRPLDQRAVIDAGFLELTAARRRCRPSDADVAQSLPVVDADDQGRHTASGPGWHRYNGDGYGDGASDGRPVGAAAARAPGTCGRCCPRSGASSRSRRATAPPRSRCC